MPELQAVLFDMDGTLVETESLWHEAEVAAMAQFGQPWTHEEQIFALGGPFETVVTYMANKANVDEAAVADVLEQSIETLMRERPLPLQPGVQALYDEAVATGLPVGLVTNSFRSLVDIVLESSGLTFDVVVAGDEVTDNKPHPGPYLTACEQLGVTPELVVVLEDSSTGIESALAAGCSVIGIPHAAPIQPEPGLTVVKSVTDVNLALLADLASARAAVDR